MTEISSRRIPSLDGLRGAAVLLVILGHSARSAGFALRPAGWAGVNFDVAHFGVSIFFILSGFLITTLLVEEHRRTGAVSLRDFYIRRTIRIFPASYLYMGTVAVLSALGYVELREGDLLHAVTYTMNYHHQRAWALGHLWSLGVEEQFYLIWPLCFLLLGERRSLFLAIALIAAVPMLRVVTWLMLPELRIGIDEEFQLVCDGLATGCALSLVVAFYGVGKIVTWIPRPIFAIAPLTALAGGLLAPWPSFNLPFGVAITNLSIGLMVLWCVAHADSVVGRLLNAPIALFLGAISYSLYLWQQLFMDATLLPAPAAFPVNVMLALLAAVGSYYLLERPLQALRQRFRH